MNKSRLTPDEVVARLAEKARLTPEQVRTFLQAQVELASEQARSDYPVPGIGVLQLTDRPARSLVMRFGPEKGKTVVLPTKKVLKVRVCKMLKDVVFGNSKSMPDVFDPHFFDVTWYLPGCEPED